MYKRIFFILMLVSWSIALISLIAHAGGLAFFSIMLGIVTSFFYYFYKKQDQYKAEQEAAEEQAKIKAEEWRKEREKQDRDYEEAVYKSLIKKEYISSNALTACVNLYDLKRIRKNKDKPYAVNFDCESKIAEAEQIVNKHLEKCNKSFVAFDFETTGLDCSRDKIIQIGAVKVDNGKIVDAFCEYVNPERHIPAAASEVNEIYDETVEDCETINIVLPEFIEFIEDYRIIAHNLDFDLPFLQREYKKVFGQEFPNRSVCSMAVWVKEFKANYDDYPESKKLEYVASVLLSDDDYNNYINSQHDALADAEALAKICLLIL